MRCGFLLLLAAFWPVPGFGQPRTAPEAQRYSQAQRQEARSFWEKQDPQGVRILESLAALLDTEPVLEMAEGSLELELERAGTYYDLARAHAALGQADEAIASLRKMHTAGLLLSETTKQLDQDPLFDPLRDDPRFRATVQQLSRKSFWTSPAFETEYRENLSDQEKIAGLSKLWSEVKYNFAFFDQVPDLDWDALYIEFIPKVLRAETALEYYRLLQRMCARLQDGHTSVHFPQELQPLTNAKPPIETALIEERVLVTEVWSPGLRSEGVRSGLEILQIDGMPVHGYAEEHVTPYQSSSTRQDLAVRTFSYGLLKGPEDRPVEITFEDKNGRRFTKRLVRSGHEDTERPWQPFRFRMLDENVAHVVFNTFGDPKVVEAFAAEFESIQEADALIVDVRGNGGGSSSVGYEVLAYLTDRPFQTSRWATREYRPAFRAWDAVIEAWYVAPAGETQPNDKKPYLKPVVLLTGPQAGSAAEDFCVAFDFMGRGTIVGERTGGSTGQPLMFPLPGGGWARVCTKRDTYPDGKEFVGYGVEPDIEAWPTVADLRTGRDTVLDAAMRHLRETLKR